MRFSYRIYRVIDGELVWYSDATQRRLHQVLNHLPNGQYKFERHRQEWTPITAKGTSDGLKRNND